MSFHFPIVFLILIQFISKAFTFTKTEKIKVEACLILYRQRRLQDPQTLLSLFQSFSKLFKDYDQKISMYTLTKCYFNINETQSNNIIHTYSHHQQINSLTEENQQLLSLNEIGKDNYEDINTKMNSFIIIFNEVYEHSKRINSYNNSSLFSEKKWYQNYLVWIIIFVVVIHLILLIAMCVYRKH